MPSSISLLKHYCSCSMSSELFPWLALVAIIWLQAISSANTDFPAYSSQLKSRLAITQLRLNYLAVASDAGKLFGFLPGILARSSPLPSLLALGSALSLLGYGLQFLSLTRRTPALSYCHYALLQLLAGNSVCWINTACYLSAMRNFPLHTGTVIALATSYTALTAKLYVAIAQILPHDRNDTSVYLLLNCLVPLAVSLASAPLMADTNPEAPRGNGAGLLAAFAITCATGAYAVVQTLVPALAGESVIPPAVLLVMVGSVCVVPLVAVIFQGSGATEVEEMEAEDVPNVGWIVATVEFWLYFLVYLSGATVGLVFGNNLGQIAQSRAVRENILLSIYSSFGFFGKLSAAPLSALSRSKYAVSLPGSVAILMVPMSCAFFLLVIPNTTCLSIGTAIIGACSGAITSIAVFMTSDLFGREHFGVNHNIVVANIPLGSLVFGYVAAHVYDQEGGGDGGDGLCVGARCYGKTFIIWGSVCTFGTFLSFVLYIRTKKRLARI